MKHCNQNCIAGPADENWFVNSRTRFPDLRHQLKLSWRDALKALVGPAERLHHLRSMRSAMFYDAVDKLDRPGDCDET